MWPWSGPRLQFLDYKYLEPSWKRVTFETACCAPHHKNRSHLSREQIQLSDGTCGNRFIYLANHMDLFSLISAPNTAKVKTRTHPRTAHEVPLLTATANRVIDMEDMIGASRSSRTPSTVEKSPLDFSNEDPPPLITESIRAEEQGQDEMYHRAAPVGNPPYTGVALEPDLEKETVDTRALVSKRRRKRGLDESTLGGKSLASIGIGTGTTVSAPATQEIPIHTEGMSDPDSLSYAKPRPAPEQDVAQKAVVTKDSDSKKPTSFTSMVTKLLKKAVAQVARRDQRIEAREKHIRNLEALLEAEAQIMGEERIKAAFEEFKKYEDD
nr:hypothetical protein [Tanacetum cinerariifolium]